MVSRVQGGPTARVVVSSLRANREVDIQGEDIVAGTVGADLASDREVDIQGESVVTRSIVSGLTNRPEGGVDEPAPCSRNA